MANKGRGDPVKQAWRMLWAKAFAAWRREQADQTAWTVIMHWNKHDRVDETGHDGVKRKRVVLNPHMGRIELWRLGGTRPDGAMLNETSAGVIYGLETPVPHAMKDVEQATGILNDLGKKFGA